MRYFIFTALLITITGCGALNSLFAGGPYKGKVVDAETKEPLEGAVVLAIWYRAAPGFGGTSKDFLDAEEVITDSNGEFMVGKNPPSSWIPGTWVTDPSIIIFKPGYGYFPRYHAGPRWPPTGYEGLLKLMEREGVIIELSRLKTREEQLRGLDGLDPFKVPDEKKSNLSRLLKVEYCRLGLRCE